VNNKLAKAFVVIKRKQDIEEARKECPMGFRRSQALSMS
jgi:hypothetical protein